MKSREMLKPAPLVPQMVIRKLSSAKVSFIQTKTQMKQVTAKAMEGLKRRGITAVNEQKEYHYKEIFVMQII